MLKHNKCETNEETEHRKNNTIRFVLSDTGRSMDTTITLPRKTTFERTDRQAGIVKSIQRTSDLQELTGPSTRAGNVEHRLYRAENQYTIIFCARALTHCRSARQRGWYFVSPASAVRLTSTATTSERLQNAERARRHEKTAITK